MKNAFSEGLMYFRSEGRARTACRPPWSGRRRGGRPRATRGGSRSSPPRRSSAAKACKCLAGSASAVLKRNLARKYAFDSIFQALQDLHTFAPLQSQNFRKKSVWKISNFRENSATFLQMLQNLQFFAKVQKFQEDNLVDFKKCCKTRI